MTTARDGGNGVVFICDACPDELETGYTTWPYALGAAQEEGWVRRQEGGEWFTYCPACDSRSTRSDFKPVPHG